MNQTTSTTTMNPIRAEAACRTFARAVATYPTNITLQDAVYRFTTRVSALPAEAVQDLYSRYGKDTPLARVLPQ